MRVDQAEWWAEFKIFEDRDGRYYWQLEAASGRIIARSGCAYESKYWCEQDVHWLRANAGLVMVYDHTGPLRRLGLMSRVGDFRRRSAGGGASGAGEAQLQQHLWGAGER